MNLSEWYGGSVRIPTAFDHYASVFAASSVNIAASAIDDPNRKFRIRFHSEDSFYVDIEDQCIWLSSRMLSPFNDERLNPFASVDQAISGLLGITVHEGVHAKVSYNDVEIILGHSGIPKASYNKLTYLFAGLMEDYYVDDFSMKTYPWSRWMSFSAFDYFFPESSLEEIREPFFEDGKIRTVEEARLFLSIMTLMKHPSLRFRICEALPGVAPILERCLLSINYHHKESRARYTGLMYGEIFDLSQCEELQDDDKGDPIPKSIDLRRVPGNRKPKLKITEFDQKLDRLIQDIGRRHIEQIDKIDHMVYHVKPESSLERVNMNRVFFDLAKLSRALASKPKLKGLRTDRGHRVADPSRIITDGRIFRERAEKQTMLPLEIIILVDCSGSMTSYDNIRKAFEAACGAAYGLVSGGHQVCILGHTADTDSIGILSEKQSVVIYVVKEFHESVDLAQYRAYTIVKKLSKAQNRDGEAILAASKYFTKRKYKRCILVISDGEPCADFYGGSEAVEHTARCVATIRQSNITIMSISIDESAVDSNNQIYGEAANTFNEDPLVIEKILSTLLQNGADNG